ncbi:kinase-like domain-containing protein [Xylaria venustula]|nr:kinase-like domain-containing protein [Xylaria venustula]
MSWNLTKKLKDAHLGSLANFSRSSSSVNQASVVDTGNTAATISAPTNEAATTPLPANPSTKPTLADHQVQTTTGTLELPLPRQPIDNPAKPGILVLTLYEARGLSLPKQYQNVFAAHNRNTNLRSTGDALAPADFAHLSLTSQTSTTFTPSTPSNRPQTSAGSGFSGIPQIHGRVSTRYMPYALVDFDKVQVFISSVEGNPENPLWAGSNTQYKFDVSHAAELTVHLFLRHPNSTPTSSRSEDIFLGVVRLLPRLEPKSALETETHGNKAGPDRDHGFSGIEWVAIQHGTGRIQIGVEYVENQVGKLSISDFELLKVVGKGSFGKVMQIRKKDTNRIYAIKTIRKAKIISRSEVAHTLAERSVLAQINNPFIVPLKFSFQSPEKLYFVLAFVNGGELFHHLSREGRFDINRSRFYAAELLCALECLHGFNVIYRDLKPENILLDYQGHIALCDFGLCKLEMKDEDRTNTFCGTPEYLAPELLLGQGYNKTVDWWTLGVLLYEMLTGLPPFYDEVTNEMYRKILSEPLHFPGLDVVPPAAKDLLTKLLNRNPAERLGANGSAEIKSHPFFHAIDWRKLLQRKYEPAFKPRVVRVFAGLIYLPWKPLLTAVFALFQADALDTTNFDPEFTSEAPLDSYVDDPVLSQTMQGQFTGFSYNRPVAGLSDAGGSIKDPSFIDGSESRR